jgi:hypothetical protein
MEGNRVGCPKKRFWRSVELVWPTKPLQQTGHAIDGRARYTGSCRVSRSLSLLFGEEEASYG